MLILRMSNYCMILGYCLGLYCITKFPGDISVTKMIQEALYETWTNNDYLSRWDILKLCFFSAAPEPIEKSSHKAFHFIKLRRPDTKAKKFVKDPLVDEVHLVDALHEDDCLYQDNMRVMGLSQRWKK